MNTTKNLLSKRQYIATWIEGDAVCNQYPTLSDILDDDNYEWKYALQDIFDELLDVTVGCRMEVQFNRDNKDSLGFIKRIK